MEEDYLALKGYRKCVLLEIDLSTPLTFLTCVDLFRKNDEGCRFRSHDLFEVHVSSQRRTTRCGGTTTT